MLHKDWGILGKKFVQNFFAKPLDKMWKMWYNGKFAAHL